ncbi:acetyltransferase [Rossellomorea aquimaris]|uniref:acetyltransferase n=1 Tax=Rossellomorea aquimaris TaxID=189382 RepID=UPI0007D061D2|nr:acetyltransferase [Rossellomorea aquimaris]
MKVIVIGNGGHSKVIQEMMTITGEHSIYAILDDKYKIEQEIQGIIYAPIASISNLLDLDTRVVVAIGNNSIRKKIVKELNLPNEAFLTVIDSSSTISRTASIGNGTVVMPKAIINADSIIGDHCIINTGAIVEHENTVESYAHISPNATLTGNVTIREGVHIGASATVIPGLEIQEWSVIGAGSTVIQPIPSHSKAVGSPARIIKKVFEVVMKETM